MVQRGKIRPRQRRNVPLGDRFAFVVSQGADAKMTITHQIEMAGAATVMGTSAIPAVSSRCAL